jgi:hypothetical protein
VTQTSVVLNRMAHKTGPKLSTVVLAAFLRESEQSDGSTSGEWLEMQSAPMSTIVKKLTER